MFIAVAALVLAAAPVTSREADITVLSAGAVEPGLRAFAQLVTRETGHDLTIQFNTARAIR